MEDRLVAKPLDSISAKLMALPAALSKNSNASPGFSEAHSPYNASCLKGAQRGAVPSVVGPTKSGTHSLRAATRANRPTDEGQLLTFGILEGIRA